MSIFNVSNATELKSAIATAVDGDDIVLADGDYGSLSINNRYYASTMTIAAADGAKVHFDGITISNSQNLTLSGFDIGRDLKAGEGVYVALNTVTNSSHINLRSMTIHGSQDGVPGNDGRGLSVIGSSYFTVSNSTFTELAVGIIQQKSSNTSIVDNHFQQLRSDGIDSAAMDGSVIRGNTFTDFAPVAGDHPDAIQFFNTNMPTGTKNVTIENNVIMQGRGVGTQGIFMSDPGVGYENVLIRNNLVYSNDQYNGIFVRGAQNVSIIDNTLLSTPDDGKSQKLFVDTSSNVVISGNVAEAFYVGNDGTNATMLNNLDLSKAPTARAGLHNLTAPASPSDLVLPGVGYHFPTSAPPSPIPAPAPDPLPPVDAGDIQSASTIHGDAGNNMLAAADPIDGSTHAHVMYGYGGDDTYFVAHSGDIVREAIGEGNDTIIAAVSHTLVAGSEVELLRTMGSASTYAADLTGNELDNVIVGNAAGNRIDGGIGADTMWGYGGNDTYFVDNSRDVVKELAGGGNDTVIATTNYTLTGGSEIELLRTMGSASSYAIDLTGNALDNTIAGNAAANTIHGGAGKDMIWGYGGDDLLFGDQGNDTFVFGPGFGRDTIADFAEHGAIAGDSIRFLAGTFSSFNDLMGHASQQGNNVVFTLDTSNSVTLVNSQLAALSAHDFIFG